MDESNDEFNNSSTVFENKWNEGDECIAKWEEDGCWYRAVFEGVEGDTAVVTFIQYGNSAYCPIEFLRGGYFYCPSKLGVNNKCMYLYFPN